MKATINFARFVLALVFLAGYQVQSGSAQNLSVPIDRIVDTLPPGREPVNDSEFDFPAFTYFDSNIAPDSIINAYLLGYLSDRIYADDTGYDQEWVEEFKDELELNGALNVEFFSHPTTGAEVATVETFSSLIVVHRGSSSAGSTVYYSLTDWWVDFDDDARQEFFGKELVYVHEGFSRSSASVYGWILPIIQDAYARGKNIWVTGHSLGGANAMLTAARLHYRDGISVKGLHTFGAPRVGDADFGDLMDSENTSGFALADHTTRWVVDGDSAVSLFGGDWVTRYTNTRWGRRPTRFWVSYHHVGQVNHIFRIDDASGTDFQLWEDAPDLSNDTPFSVLSLNDEHLDYVRAMDAMLAQQLEEQGRMDLLFKLLKL
ncbi:MAG: lipase family protein [Aureliella sp.]